MSAARILRDIPTPRDWPGVPGARGTQATCTAQGVFLHLGSTGAGCYNACLALYYYLAVRKDFRLQLLLRGRLEWAMHGTAILWPSLGATLAVIDGAFNSASEICWFASVPFGCGASSGVECVRGANADLLGGVFAFATLVACMCIATVATVLLCRSARINNFNIDTGSEASSGIVRLKRLITVQSVLYLGAFYLTWVLMILTAGLAVATDGEENFPLILVSSTMNTMQGVFNVVVFMRRPGCLDLSCCFSPTSVVETVDAETSGRDGDATTKDPEAERNSCKEVSISTATRDDFSNTTPRLLLATNCGAEDFIDDLMNSLGDSTLRVGEVSEHGGAVAATAEGDRDSFKDDP